jgi:hypothetical protein
MRQYLMGAICVGLLGFLEGIRADSPKESGWKEDYEAARVEARKAGKPLLVVFR